MPGTPSRKSYAGLAGATLLVAAIGVWLVASDRIIDWFSGFYCDDKALLITLDDYDFQGDDPFVTRFVVTFSVRNSGMRDATVREVKVRFGREMVQTVPGRLLLKPGESQTLTVTSLAAYADSQKRMDFRVKLYGDRSLLNIARVSLTENRPMKLFPASAPP